MPSYQIGTSTAASSRASSVQSDRQRFPDSTRHLRPEDAFQFPSQRRASGFGPNDVIASENRLRRSSRDKRRGRSSSRRRNPSSIPKVTGGQWKKLLWVRQSYPDNYTDEETFLDHWQVNPRLRPYEFWPLVADSTIIVQHVCSVVIFVCCFTAIFQERVSPQTVVGWASLCTVAGWVFRDYWQSRSEEIDETNNGGKGNAGGSGDGDNTSSHRTSTEADAEVDLGVHTKEPQPLVSSSLPHSRTASVSSVFLGIGGSPKDSSSSFPIAAGTSETIHRPSTIVPQSIESPSSLSPRMLERFTTAKSALLIYCSLLGLSPILKSLTLSTSSDSIWALSSWLLGLNIFTFDYGAGPEAKFPASLSTNAALMASTVLASRLPTTTHVFSLTLFSIEVFGLFPVFRRHLRHHSWTGHLWLTTSLVVLASGGLSMTISGGGWGMGLVGVVLGGIFWCLSMGLTSWWLINLQRYKNEIHGPWDPARPVIRRHWD